MNEDFKIEGRLTAVIIGPRGIRRHQQSNLKIGRASCRERV
nr:hypothetical protein [uncultured Mesotoga sp.]